MNSKIELGRYLFAVERAGGIYAFGRVERVVGLTVEVTGLSARIGDLCWIYPSEDSRPVEAEVVGFRNDVLLLMPLAELQGVHSGSLVKTSGTVMSVPVGEGLLGRTLDGLGRPIDGLGPLDAVTRYPMYAEAPEPLKRKRIGDTIHTGVRAIDGLLTVGKG